MAVIDHETALERAGANLTGPIASLVFLLRRYPLGAAGALIMLLFVATAIFADALTSQRAGRMCDRESFAIPGMIGISPSVLESQFASFCLSGNTAVGQTAGHWLNLHSFASADLRKSQFMALTQL